MVTVTTAAVILRCRGCCALQGLFRAAGAVAGCSRCRCRSAVEVQSPKICRRCARRAQRKRWQRLNISNVWRSSVDTLTLSKYVAEYEQMWKWSNFWASLSGVALKLPESIRFTLPNHWFFSISSVPIRHLLRHHEPLFFERNLCIPLLSLHILCAVTVTVQRQSLLRYRYSHCYDAETATVMVLIQPLLWCRDSRCYDAETETVTVKRCSHKAQPSYHCYPSNLSKECITAALQY